MYYVKLRKCMIYCFFFSSRRRHTRFDCDWSSDVCSSDLSLIDNSRDFSSLRLGREDATPDHRNEAQIIVSDGNFEMSAPRERVKKKSLYRSEERSCRERV